MEDYKQPETGIGSTAETNRLLAESSKQTGIVAPTFSPTGAISSESLSGGATPVTIPTPPVSTTSEGVSGAASAYIDQGKEKAKIQAEQDAKVQEAQTQDKSLKDKIAGLFGQVKDTVASRGQMEEDAGITQKVNEADEARIDLEQSQRSQTNELRALEGAALNDVQRAAQAKVINRKYAFEQADLMLTTDIAERRLDRAQKTIDRKISLALEPLKLELDFTKFFYEDNKANLTKAEDRAFNLRIDTLDKQYEATKELEKTKGSIILEAAKNGVALPSYVVSELNKATSQEEVTNVLARNGISLQDPLDRQIKEGQLAKLGVELEKAKLETIAAQVGATSPYQKERQVRTLESVKELRDRVNIQTVGFAGLARFLPASLPANFKTDLDTLKATIAFGELTAMREASKTGGALGQVSNVELGLLESALGGLSQTQSPANFKKNLDKIEASIKRWQGAANASSEEDQLRALGYTEEQIQQIKSAQ